ACGLSSVVPLDPPTRDNGGHMMRPAIRWHGAGRIAGRPAFPEASAMQGSSFSVDVVRSALDALEEQIAILDCNGAITQVNEAWKQWAMAGASLAVAAEGGRYPELLGLAAAAGDADAAEL